MTGMINPTSQEDMRVGTSLFLWVPDIRLNKTYRVSLRSGATFQVLKNKIVAFTDDEVKQKLITFSNFFPEGKQFDYIMLWQL